jgi:hypothetical protein
LACEHRRSKHPFPLTRALTKAKLALDTTVEQAEFPDAEAMDLVYIPISEAVKCIHPYATISKNKQKNSITTCME